MVPIVAIRRSAAGDGFLDRSTADTASGCKAGRGGVEDCVRFLIPAVVGDMIGG
jgi:hypothetical protein